MNINRRVIHILWLRQIKRYYRSKPRLIGSLGQPLLFLLAFGFGFGPTFSKAGQGNYIQFIAPGIVGMSVLFLSISFGIEIIWDRQFGFLKETLVAPVSRLTIMIGRTLGGSTVAIIQGFIVMAITVLVGFRPLTWYGIPLALLFMMLTSVLFTAFGTAIASVMEDIHGFQMIMNFLIMPMFFLSGALYPLTDLPPVLAAIVRIDPMTYGVDGMRAALIGVSHIGIGTDIAVLTVMTSILLAIGSYLFSKIQL